MHTSPPAFVWILSFFPVITLRKPTPTTGQSNSHVLDHYLMFYRPLLLIVTDLPTCTFTFLPSASHQHKTCSHLFNKTHTLHIQYTHTHVHCTHSRDFQLPRGYHSICLLFQTFPKMPLYSVCPIINYLSLCPVPLWDGFI